MRQKTRFLTLALLLTSTAIAQTRSTWTAAGDIRSGARGTAIGTVTSVDSSRNRVSVQLDSSRTDSAVWVANDSLTTRYLGFEGAGVIFTGTSGFAKLRAGDRLEVRGVGTSTRGISAEEIILLGRSLTANPTTSTGRNTIDGTVRSVRAAENIFVVETSRREIYEVTGRTSTPVYFEGRTYSITNLEPGDRVRIEVESQNDLDGVVARSIEVTGDSSPGDNSLGGVEGTITRIDTRLNTMRVRSTRGEVVVDVKDAYDSSNRRLRLADFRVNDVVSVTGRYEGTVFVADTVRTGSAGDFRPDISGNDGFGDDAEEFADAYEIVTIEGTVTRAWATDSFVVRDTEGESYTIYSDRDFVVRHPSGTGISTRIKNGNRVTVRAFRDRAERYIAQGIRIK